MVFEGKFWKDGKYWLIEVPVLDLLTQGKTRKEAIEMLRDAVALLVNQKGFEIAVRPYGDGEGHFLIQSNDDVAMLALMLRRQRAKHHLSITDMARRLRVRSRNAYAQYEHGKSQPSVTKIQEFLSAMNSKAKVGLTVIEEGMRKAS